MQRPQRMDRGHGEIGDGSDISVAPLINAAARMKGLSLLVNSTVRVQPEQWIRARHFRAKPARNSLFSGYDVAIRRFHTLSAFSPARAALRSQSTVAALSSCAAGDGAISLRW
jgi:hypothetical protein